MIRIEKDYDSVPEKLRSSECQDLVRQALSEQSNHTFKSDYYNKGCIEELKELYHFKCAYCETDSSAGAPFDIEHFRPKKKVTGIPNHIGYYWLGYEWSNLLLSCRECNTKKGGKFPIEDESKRIYHPELSDGLPKNTFCQADADLFLQEQAQLLNPELDPVEDHLIFKPNGEIHHLSERGRVTVCTFKLNRERLVFRRKKLIKSYFDDIESTLADYLGKNINESELKTRLNWLFKKLLTYQHTSHEYSRLGYFMFRKFPIFARVHLEVPEREYVVRAFNHFAKDISK